MDEDTLFAEYRPKKKMSTEFFRDEFFYDELANVETLVHFDSQPKPTRCGANTSEMIMLALEKIRR